MNQLPRSKAFIYIRRSQDRRDRQVLSPEGQLLAVAPIIENRGFAPIYLPAESRTARRPGRPIFNDMMSRIENGEAKHIVVWATSRLSRNALDAGRIINAFDEGKIISIVTVDKTYLNTADDLFILGINLGMDKKSSDDTSAGVKRGYAAKYERGEYPGYAPNGYVNGKLGEYRNIVPHVIKGSLLRSIFEQASTGALTLDGVHKYALSIGFTNRTETGPITKSSLADMLKKRLYTGIYWHGGAWRTGKYDPLISVELFDRVQYAMGYKQGPRNRSKTLNHRYKGLMVCGGCGCSITAETKFKKLRGGVEAAYTYYRCTRKNKKAPKCTEPPITEALLEQQIGEQLGQLAINKAQATKCVELLRSYHKEQVNNRNTMLEVWRQDNKEASSNLAKLLDMRLNSEITKEEFERYKLKYQEVVDRTNSLINDSSQTAKEWLELAETFFTDLIQLVETFNLGSDEEKRRMLALIGSNWVLSNKKVVFTPRRPYDLLLNDDKQTVWRAVAEQVRTHFLGAATSAMPLKAYN